jgi:hypothetical protein
MKHHTYIFTSLFEDQPKRFVMNDEGQVAFTAAIKPLLVDQVKHLDTIKFETVITDIYNNNQTGVLLVAC